MERRRHAIIDHLDPDLRSQVDRLVLEGIATYEEIRGWLAEQGVDCSLAAVGRYAKRIRAARINAGEARRLIDEIKLVGGDIGAAVDTLTGQAVFELLNTLETEHLRDNPDLLFALTALQRNFLRRQELEVKAAALQRNWSDSGTTDAPSAEEREMKTPAEIVAGLKLALERQVNGFLAHPESQTPAKLKDIKAGLTLIDEIETKYAQVPMLDRPGCFLEDLQFIIETIRELDPEGLKIVARNFDLLVARGKEKFK